ncbi:MAG: hypothetical protein JO327_13660 [Nitrososphaeraceae archaeon]|nr:hypothetical protein [Nitrososphaeraceae archaeon]MBV9669160.1 hypothetical protein [Nitrososphaeraceae archaeon]
MLKRQKTVVVAGIVISAMLFFACFAALLSLGQISIKASAQNMTGSKMTSASGSGNASMKMANKTAANSDVLMTKVRNMGITNSTTAAGSNKTNQTSD